MNADFSRTLALLRQEKEISQRKAAADLGISQALLSHYENGVREPGLAFVKKACDYYHVSADYLLGRTLDRDGGMIDSDELYDSSDEKGTLRGSIAATLQKKLLVNTVNLLFELLGKTNCREAVTAPRAGRTPSSRSTRRPSPPAQATPRCCKAARSTALRSSGTPPGTARFPRWTPRR